MITSANSALVTHAVMKLARFHPIAMEIIGTVMNIGELFMGNLAIKIPLKKKLQITQNRIETIKMHVNFHKQNIKRLKYSLRNRTQDLVRGCKKERIFSYDIIPFSEKRYQETIQNLQKQIDFLEHELAVLIEYAI